jgi:hypothetical protein
MVFNATFNNISVISWRSVLLVEETGVPGENHRPVASHWQTLSQDDLYVSCNKGTLGWSWPTCFKRIINSAQLVCKICFWFWGPLITKQRWHIKQSSNHYMRPWIRGTWIKYFICFWCLPSSKFNFEKFASICYKSWHKTVCCRIALIKIICTFIGTFVDILKGYVAGWFRTTNLTKLTWIRSPIYTSSNKKSLKIPKGQSESVYRRRTDNTMAKRKSAKGQTTIYKTLHRKLKIE